MTYAYLSQGRNRRELLELDLTLAGPDGEHDRSAIDRMNAEAQRALGPVGMLAPPPRKARRKADGDS